MKIYRFAYSPFAVNTYLLTDKTKECIIVDAGCYDSGECKHLQNFIETERLIPVKLIHTHCHLDHIFGNKFIGDTYQIPNLASVHETFNHENAPQVAHMYGVEMQTPHPLTGYLKEGETLTFGESELEILHVPGHSPGSLVYYQKEDKVAIVGDTLFKGSIGRTDLPGGNYESLIAHIQNKLLTLPDDTKIYPGHGEATTIAEEKQNNPFLRNAGIL